MQHFYSNFYYGKEQDSFKQNIISLYHCHFAVRHYSHNS